VQKEFEIPQEVRGLPPMILQLANHMYLKLTLAATVQGFVFCRSEPLKAYFVQLAVISNHQNGRDTHIRQVKVFGPRQDTVQRLMAHDVGFVSPEFLMFSVVR
jgi:hypothetical protein